MNGEAKAEHFFAPRAEAVDLYKVVVELTGRRYRLVESPASHLASSANGVFDMLVPHLRARQHVGGGGVDGGGGVIDVHVVHPRLGRDFFRHLLDESFSKLCVDLAARIRNSPDPSRESAIIVIPLFARETAISQPLYNGIFIPKALSHGLQVNCMIASRQDQCVADRMADWQKWTWPTCALVQVVPPTRQG